MRLSQRLKGFQRTKYKSIDFHGHALEVYVPTRNEMHGLMQKCTAPPQELIDEHFGRLTTSLWRTSTPEDDGIEVKGDDVIVQGQSLRTTARWLAILQLREVAMIGLVGFVEGNDVFALGYDEISQELSEADIKELVAAVEAVVKPDYKATEKN